MASYVIMRGKSDADVVNKAMRYILPKAAGYIRIKTPGAQQIRAELTSYKIRETNKAFKERTGGTARQNQQSYLANTLAAAIVAARIRKKQPNAVLPTRRDADKIDIGRINAFYDKVQRFIGSKTRSAHYLRAGFIPAFRAFDVPQRGPANQQRFKRHSRGLKAKPSLRGVAEAFATNQREGAFRLDPNAFVKAIRVAQRTFLRWVSEDMGRDAKRSGFY